MPTADQDQGLRRLEGRRRGDGRRAEGLRQDKLAPYKYPRQIAFVADCPRRPPARSSASSCANWNRGSAQELLARRDRVARQARAHRGRARPIAGRTDTAVHAAARLPARGPGLAGDVARFPAGAVRCRRRAAGWSGRAPATAARRRAPRAKPGAWTSCTARRTRCCRRCWPPSAWRNRSGCSATATALDRAAARREVPRARRRRHRAGAAHPGRGPVGGQHRQGQDRLRNHRPEQRLAKYHDDPRLGLLGWNRIWLHRRPSAAWSIEDEIASIACPLLAIRAWTTYGTLEQIRGIARRCRRPRLLELPQCGHSPQRDQPEAVIEAVASIGRATGGGSFPHRPPQ